MWTGNGRGSWSRVVVVCGLVRELDEGVCGEMGALVGAGFIKKEAASLL